MSASLVNDTHIDFLVTAALNWRVIDREEVGDVAFLLIHANVASVDYRYHSNSQKTTLPLYYFRHYAGEINAVQVLKALDCFEYQASEPPEWDESKAHHFCARMRREATCRLPGYEESQWEVKE